VVDAVLRHVRVGTSRFGRIELGEPWAVRVGARTTVSIHYVPAGQSWLELDGHLTHATRGDVLVLTSGAEHTLTSRPGAPAREAENAVGDGLSVRRRFGGDGPTTVLLCAELVVSGPARDRLLRALPPVIRLGGQDDAREAVPGLSAILGLLRDEVRGGGAGAEQVTARLAELLLLQAVRAELDRAPGGSGSWRAALDDDGIARSLDAMYAYPGRAWTVTSLAKAAGMGRTSFAQRFRELVGESPFTHLTRWRMDLATEQLRAGRSLAEIAADVGYADEFAFATAFRRVVGIAPGRARRLVAPGDEE